MGSIMAEDQDDTSLPVRLVQHPTSSDRLLIYQTGQGVRVEFRFDADTLWLTEAEMGALLGVTRQNVNLHLNNIYTEGGGGSVGNLLGRGRPDNPRLDGKMLDLASSTYLRQSADAGDGVGRVRRAC